MKNPFRSISNFFRKTIPNTANIFFSKSNMNTLRNHLQDTLASQGKILQTVGKIGVGVAAPLALGAAAFMPGALPLIGAGAGLSALIGGTGLLETSGSNLLNPRLYKGKSGLQTTSAVVNQIEKAAKGVSQITRFA